MSLITTLEGQVADFFMNIAGNPVFLGVLVVLVFFIWVFVSGMKLDGKILILVGAFFLGFALLPAWLQIVLGIAAGALLGLSLLKVLNR